MKYVLYNLTTGVLNGLCTVRHTTIPLCNEDEGYIIVETDINPKDYYVNVITKTLEIKPLVPYTIDKYGIVADGIDYITISTPIIPCCAMISRKTYRFNDGVIEFSTLNPGAYEIMLYAQNYAETYIEVTAT